MQPPYDFSSCLLIDDFDTFVRYLESNPNLPLTGAGDLKAADLWAINERVNYKAPHYVTARSRQADYPLLGFLFQIATVSRLFIIQFSNVNTLMPDVARIDAYRSLTLEEKYVFLLETAWCYLDWTVLDGDGRSGQGADWFRTGVRQLLRHPVDAAVTLTQDWSLRNRTLTVFASSMANIYVRAGHWFGWYDVREITRAKRDKYSLEIDQLKLSPWGDQCLTTLLLERPFRYWNKNAGQFVFFDGDNDIEPEASININTFAEPLRTLLGEPDLLSLYPINSKPPTGEFWLRVELPEHGVSRTLAVPATSTLDGLHGLIQKSVKFDNDHLYNFYLNWRNPLNGECYSSPEDDWSEDPPADTIWLAQLNLYEGQVWLYVFDLSTRWEFYITVVRHLPDAVETKARVVEKVGRSPKQYPDW
ncbi:IS1096 element passenger TnpR family protein [Spirosoma fluviale]|uniref:PRiA4b ORF-3-like protein n=1 Tax=Spirosoma fluviale TaxID=1597977 RepID=A0A286G1G2_9BACT|nr:hypothetical protein [Spirosoma fluviale]SOD89292.1 pRiA4b ORF-3-like protein [Spirosoma fluviale]